MGKRNCWEVKQCGREPGGKHGELGVCPVTVDARLDGVHGGKNAGRTCWIIAGTLCGGTAQGSFAKKFDNCELCEFFKAVKEEEGKSYEGPAYLFFRLKNKK